MTVPDQGQQNTFSLLPLCLVMARTPCLPNRPPAPFVARLRPVLVALIALLLAVPLAGCSSKKPPTQVTLVEGSAASAETSRQDNPSAPFALGVTAYMQQHYDEALQYFSQALTQNSGSPRAYNNRGVTYYALGDYAKAVADFSAAAQSNGADAEQALFNRAIAYQALKDYDRALADYEQLLSRNPRFSAALNNKADILINLHRYDQAVVVLDAAIKVAPSDPDLYFNQALALEQQGISTRAMADYDRAIALRANFGQAYLNRGVLRLRLQQVQPGCGDLQLACDFGLCTHLEKAKKFGLCD